MTVEVKVPRLAESISDAVLVQWLKQDGETVRADEPIVTLETDKAAVEIPADQNGVLRHARKVGDRVEVGDVLARIEDGAGAGDGQGTAATAAPAPQPAPTAAPRPEPAAASPTPQPAPAPGPAKPTEARATAGDSKATAPRSTARARETEVLSPAVRRMVDEHGLDPAEIQGSGKGGRLLKEDVQRHLDSRSEAPAPAGQPFPSPPDAPPATVVPQGAPAPVGPPRAEPAGVSSEPAWSDGEEERAVPMSRIRQRIAERLVRAQQTAAILTTFNEIDMTRVMDLRSRMRESFEERHGVKLSYMSLFGRACVLTLHDIPEINAEIRGTDIVYHRNVHLGVAVQTPRGLVVPVVHDADRRSFADLEREIARLALAARENRLMLSELSGGTFTLSNGGVFGSLLSTPILNPPQSGILGMHKIEKRPIAVDDRVVIRPMMYVALSYDHRIVDGEQAVTFLVRVKQRLEDPERMLLDL